MQPSVHPCRDGADRLNLFFIAPQSDDAKSGPHPCDLGNQQIGHGTSAVFLRRGLAFPFCSETRWRTSTSSPLARQCAARRSATSRLWHFSGPGSEHNSATLAAQEAVSTFCGTPRFFISSKKAPS